MALRSGDNAGPAAGFAAEEDGFKVGFDPGFAFVVKVGLGFELKQQVISDSFAGLGMPFTAKSLRAFVVTNWRKARVPDDVLRGRGGHDDATPVTGRHYHYRDEVAHRQETDQLVGPLLHAAPDRGPDPSAEGAEVISLHAVRAARRSG